MVHPADPTFTDGVPMPRRVWAVLAIWTVLALSVLDASIANVALPTIAAELGVAPADSVWVINAYQLAIAACLLPLSALGDRFEYRRVYLTGVAVFTLGSLGCALSGSLPALVAARVVQGLGAAGVMSTNPALVRITYPTAQLGRGIGWNAAVIAVCAASGPSIAAGILAVAPWPWLFAVNLPIGLAALAIGARALPRSPRLDEPFDGRAAVGVGVGLGGVVLGAELVARHGAWLGWGLAGVGLAVLGYGVAREWRRPAPLVPLDLLRLPVFALSIAASLAAFSAQLLAFVGLPFWFERALGRDTAETALLITPWPLGVGLAASIAGRLADRTSAAWLGGLGLALFGCGLAALAVLPIDASNGDIAWRMALCGVGFGTFQAPNNRTLLSAAPRARSGAAGGALAAARVLGQTAGAVGAAMVLHLGGVERTPIGLALAAGLAALGALASVARARL